MLLCDTCKSEVTDAAFPCPKCGTPVAAATVAMVAPTPSRTSLPRLSQSSIPDEGRFPPGTLVNGRYRMVGLLGRGGMGEVYRATDLTLAQVVALKFLPEAGVSERVLERFHAEVRIARQISHPNVCRVYDIGEVDGQPFISMEYVDGEDLADLLQRIGRLPADKALDTARKICAGLSAAHDKGVIHRDLKPQNIMLNKRGEPVIMDFGLAAVADQLTGAEARNGTPAYMSPEQLRGDEVTAKSDIYALGLVLYEIFSGRRAYEAKTIGDLLKLQEGAQMTSLTSLAADVDPQVEKVVKRCLNPNPTLRPATPLAVAAALPGGDPLAAALAAGETPSPELVAASGKTEGMELRYSIPLLVFVLAVMVGVPLWAMSTGIIQRIPSVYSPSIAGHEARKIAASLGYTQTPTDTLVEASGTNQQGQYWKSHDRKGKSWTELITAEPFLNYYYRESRAPLVAWPFGYANSGNPAPNTTGMIAVALNGTGRLRGFEAISPEKLEGTAGTPFAENPLFQAMGFDQALFVETPPEWVPVVNSDFRKAWKGPAPGLPDVEVRVEAASLGGKLTSLRVAFPWSEADREPPKSDTGAALIGPLIDRTLKLMAALAAILLARRNLRLNRGDRKGAFRLAAVGAGAAFIHWFGSAHHVAALEEWDHLLYAVGDAVFSGLVLWFSYLALEPAVRARWPHSLVTWSRLITGRFGDAQLGSHILIGAAAGFIIALAFIGPGIIEYTKTGLPQNNNLSGTWGTLSWIGLQAGTLHNALRTGFIVFFAVFLFRMLVKNDYLAAFLTAMVFATLENNGIWARNWMETMLLVAIFGLLVFLLLRVGVVVPIVAIIFVNSTGRMVVGPGWYLPYGLATITLLTSIALYGFWRSIGARNLGDETA